MYFSHIKESQKENGKAAITVNEEDTEDEEDYILADDEDEVLEIPYEPQMNSDIDANPHVCYDKFHSLYKNH